jgi:hypothetical protein
MTNITDSARTASSRPSSLESLEHVDHAPSMQGPREDKGLAGCNISVLVVGGENKCGDLRGKNLIFSATSPPIWLGAGADIPSHMSGVLTDDILLLSSPATLPTPMVFCNPASWVISSPLSDQRRPLRAQSSLKDKSTAGCMIRTNPRHKH